MLKNKLKDNGGITLIALVITIVVMLILAGVTINLTLGENGIFTTAQQAAKNYTEAQNKEMAGIDDFTTTVDKAVESIQNNYEVAGTILKTQNNINYTADGAGNTIPVPVGFSPITTKDQGTRDTGFVIKNNTDGNEFVWVPVGSIENYKRVGWTRADWDYSQTLNEKTGEITRKNLETSVVWTETMPIDERDSVTAYGGFYIGRYEAGITGGTKGETLEDGTYYTGNNKKLVVQKGEQVWNYIEQGRALTESTGLYNKTEDNVISKLCSSYAWDSALKFIENQNSTYPTNSVGDNTLGVTGEVQRTGYYAVNNIYDMGGNVREWTTENCSMSEKKGVYRGGVCTHAFPAATRYYGSLSYTDASVSFRVTMFI